MKPLLTFAVAILALFTALGRYASDDILLTTFAILFGLAIVGDWVTRKQ